MAEVLFRQELAKRLNLSLTELQLAGYRVLSAGTMGSRDAPASSGAVAEMAARGLDLGAHRSQPLTVELIHRAERIFVMTPDHRRAVEQLVPGAAVRVQSLDPEGPITDPMGGSADDYRRAAEHIVRAVATRVQEFINEDRDW
jgi:protein-tyrosine-phosphatase